MKNIFYSFALLLAMADPGKAQVITQDSLAVYDLFYTPLVPGVTLTVLH